MRRHTGKTDHGKTHREDGPCEDTQARRTTERHTGKTDHVKMEAEIGVMQL